MDQELLFPSPSDRKARRGTHAGALRIAVMVALLSLMGAGVAWGYVIFLKDGSQLSAREKYRVEGPLAIMVLQSGVTTSLPLEEIDIERTNEENARSNLGSAKVLDGLGGEENVLPPPPEKRDSLADVIRRRNASRQDAALPEPRAAVVEDAEASGEPLVPRTTTAGFAELTALRRELLTTPEIGDAIGNYLRGQGVSDVGVYRGTSDKQPLVEVITPSEAVVFKALLECAGALVQILEEFPDQVEAFELLLVSDPNGSRGSRAGQFQMTPELADLLISETVTPPEFFLRYVEF